MSCKSRYVLLGLVSAGVLSACSSPVSRTTASGSFDYLESEELATFVVPDELDAPSSFVDYNIPAIEDTSGPLGANLSVRSPQLVLPIVAGSHLAEGSKLASVWFDKVDDSQPLDKAIWNTVLNYLEKNEIAVVSFTPETGELVTDWLVSEYDDETRWYQWSSVSREVGERFEFRLDMKAHGRAAELSVVLKDYLETRNGEMKDEIDAIAKRREETNILNQVISFYEYNLRLEDSRRLSKIKQGVATALGFNADGEPSLVVSEKYDVVWPRLLLVLKKLGFDVKDIDKSAGLMFVNYSGGDASWWSGLFSSDSRFVKEGDYRLKVGKLGDKSAVTFMDDESKAFTPDQVADIFETFASVMADDNLDI